MKIRIAIFAAWVGTLALAQTNLAQAAYSGPDPNQQQQKLNVTASISPINGDLAVRGLAPDVLVPPSESVRMASCFVGIGGGVYEICTGTCWRTVDGIEYAAPCLMAVAKVEELVRRHKNAHKTH